MAYNERGEEILDDTPIEVPLKFKRPPSIQEMIQLYVRAEMQVRGLIAPDSTTEEDFDVGDDAADDILTPYELHALAADMEAGLRAGKKGGVINRGRKEGVDDGRPADGGDAGGVAKGDGKDAKDGKTPGQGGDGAEAKDGKAGGGAVP